MKKYHKEKVISKESTDLSFMEKVEIVLDEKKRIFHLGYLS